MKLFLCNVQTSMSTFVFGVQNNPSPAAVSVKYMVDSFQDYS